jgi:D-3-phosphoglycerate dehydrogenase
MYKYNCLNPISSVGLNNFTKDYEATDKFEEAQGVLARSAKMHDMELSDNLLAVARAGAGVNNIPLDKCAEKGIVVFNTPGANANGVKELVLAALLLGARDVVGGINWVDSVKDDENIAALVEKGKKAFAGNEIAGKKLGVIGLGAIGVKVANAAAALGMEVYGYDPYISVGAAWTLSTEVEHAFFVEDIYRECDYITIHVPLMDSTKGMINAQAVSMMKKDAVILNFARDLLCDEEAIVKALEEGKIKKYITDFPNPVTAGAKGVIAIPHLGASTEESEDNCAVMAVKELRNFLENGNIANSVNYPACDMGVCATASRVAVCHKNVPAIISAITQSFGEASVNISNMSNKSKGDYAYTMLDLDEKASDDVIAKIAKIDGVIKVRVVK